VVITDNEGDTAQTTQHVTVAPASHTFSAPTAVFSAPSGREGAAVAFDGSASVDPNPGGSLAYRWNFGDGSLGAGAHPSHTFQAGRWTVSLTVTDSASGMSDTVSHVVTIADERPTVSFAAPNGIAGHRVVLQGSGADRDGSITTWRWAFGDRTHGKGPHVTHTYAKPGRYRVTLTVTDASRQTVSITHTVVIGARNACLVPALRGKTFSAAQRQIAGTHCRLATGKAPKKPARRPGKGKTWRLVVIGQAPPGGSLMPRGATVRVTLAWRAI
jgi:PKD repeat protein